MLFKCLQNSLIEHYASLKELEARAGVANNEEGLGEVRILSVSGWPAHDLLLLVRDDLEMPMQSEITGLFGTPDFPRLIDEIKTPTYSIKPI